jgi:hypothetical protein
MSQLVISFSASNSTLPRLRFVSDYSLNGAQIWAGNALLLRVATREELETGVCAFAAGVAHQIAVRATHPTDVRVEVDGRPARRDDLHARPPSRSAWIHAWLALGGSMFGFIAGALYVVRSQASGDPWAMKMAWHMAVWHLLLTLTLFPASVWGQQLGIRVVQLTSVVFFAIHLGIALSNAASGTTLEQGMAIAAFNAVSAAVFLAAALWGFRAYRDMDPAHSEHSCSK